MWAAIISAASALVGTIVGGLISYRIAKNENETRIAELQQQLEQQRIEARRNRLVEARKSYLIPLRETVSKWATELTRMIGQVDSLGIELKMAEQYPFTEYLLSKLSNLDNSQKQTMKQAIGETEAQMSTFKGQLEVLRGQVNDIRLSEAIDKVLLTELDVSIKSWPILNFTWAQWTGEKKDVKAVDDALKAISTTSVELRLCLQKVNKRVEELLIGEDAT